MKKVFISSTYIDLVPHRRALWELIKGFNAEVKGMEAFGARTSAPLETCIEQVFESDIYIGIIGMRYGSVDGGTGKSFTEIEYETAYRQKKEILIYLLDEINGLVHPNQIDFNNYRALEALKSKLKERHTVDNFVNENDLVIKLNKRIKQLVPRKDKRFIRPQIINCQVTRFKISGIEWQAFIGYLYGTPVEFFLIPSNNFYSPKYILAGKIIKNIEDFDHKISVRYDFQYIDDEGYKNTIEGLSRITNKTVTTLNGVMSKLLQNETDFENILALVSAMDLAEIGNKQSLIRGIRKAIEN